MKTTCNKLNNTPTDTRASLYVWQANNVGRGGDNVTISAVSPGTPRAKRAAKQSNVLASVRVAGWQGKINLTDEVRATLGI